MNDIKIDQDEITHPLFLTCCPRDEDFVKNSALGALVALIEEESAPVGVKSDCHDSRFSRNISRDKYHSSKVDRSERYHRLSRRPHPYDGLDKNKSSVRASKATLGQVQICLALSGI